jgi:cbb3-type cytochrome oxidase subunit 3
MVIYLIIFFVLIIIGIIIYFIFKRNKKNDNEINNENELNDNIYISEIEKKNDNKIKNSEEMNELEEPLINKNKTEDNNIEQFNIKEKNKDVKKQEKIYTPPQIENNIIDLNKNNEQKIDINPQQINEEPIIKKEEPIIKKEEPIIKKEEPIIKKEEPIIKKEEPIIKKEEPIIKKEEPIIKKEVPIEEPAIKKKQLNIIVPSIEKPPEQLPTLNNLINSQFNLPKKVEEEKIISEEISVSQSEDFSNGKKHKIKDRLKKARMLAHINNEISVQKSSTIAQKANELEKVLSQNDHANTLPTLESEIIQQNEVNVLEKKTTLTKKKKKSNRYFDENDEEQK